MRRLVTCYLDDFLARGDAVAFAQRRGLRTFHWSYQEIASSSFAFAERLAERDTGKNDRVLLCGANSPEWVIAFFGCLLRGAIVVPLDTQSDAKFVERIQQQVNAKLAIFDRTARQTLRLPLPVVSLDEIEKTSECDQRPITENDIAEIVFTSGTTAEPKGVVLTHQNLLANIQPLERELGPYLKWERLVHPIRFLNLLPLSHVFGQFMGIFVPQLLGGEVFFIDSLKPSQIVETVKRERISVIVCVPRMLDTLRERVEREYQTGRPGRKKRFQAALEAATRWSVPRRWWEFRSIHRMLGWKFWAFISGGATLDEATDTFWHRLGFAVIQGYGLTETTSLVSVNHPFKKKRGSIGRVMRGQEVKLSSEGEILVRGANVSSGYWDQTGATNDGLSSQGSDKENWFHTGDVGELDAKGNLYFKGRRKEVIVTAAGLNVYPEDLEAALIQQPEIRAAAVVGMDGPYGPEPLAALLVRAGSDVPLEEVIRRANQSLAGHQQIRRWFVWPGEDFPRTSTQKIKRQEVAQRIIEASTQPLSASASDPLSDLIARIGGEIGNLNPDAKLGTDVKLDSLGRLELLSAIEDRYQIEISESDFNDVTTVGEIQSLINRRGSPTSFDGVRPTEDPEPSSYPYPHWPHRWPVSWLRTVGLYLIIFPFVRVMARPRVRGNGRLRNLKPPVLFVSNHLSMVDHALILWALPGRFHRHMSIAMDGELLRELRHPPQGASWFIRLRDRVKYLLVAFFFNVFAMPQKGGFRRSFGFAGEMVDGGYSVLVFPEGRRSPNGQMHSFRAGTGLLAQQLQVPVVPIRIDGIYELRQQGKHFAPADAITINIGTPVSFSAEQTAEEISRELEVHVRTAG